MGAEGETRKDPERSAEGETRKDPAARCSVSDVVAKDIVPQNAYPGCQMGVAKRERDTKEDFHARSVAVVGMKPLLASFFVPMISCSLTFINYRCSQFSTIFRWQLRKSNLNLFLS